MLSIYVSENSGVKQCQVVSYSVKRGIVSCSNVESTTVEHAAKLIKKNYARISVQTDGILIEKVEMPDVKDDSALAPLIKRRLSHVPNIDESIFAYSKGDISQASKKVMTYAYIIPNDTFAGAAMLPSKTEENVDMYTTEMHGLFAISRKVNTENYVFNAYADDKHLFMVLSTDKAVVYSRVVDIPANIKFDEDIENFFYENLNLTYLHLTTTYNDRKIDTILTGRLHYFSALNERLVNFLSANVVQLDYESFTSNVSKETFHKFIVPIGVALLDGAADYSNDVQKGDRTVRRYLQKFNIGFIGLVIGSLAFFLWSYMQSVNAEQLLDDAADASYQGKMNVIAKMKDPATIVHYTNSVDIITTKYNTSLQLVPIVQDLLGFIQLGTVEFEGIGENAKVTISGSISQDDYSSLNEFEAKVDELVGELGEYQVTVEDESLHTYKGRANTIDIVITMNK